MGWETFSRLPRTYSDDVNGTSTATRVKIVNAGERGGERQVWTVVETAIAHEEGPGAWIHLAGLLQMRLI
jgi:hypothetical protein